MRKIKRILFFTIFFVTLCCSIHLNVSASTKSDNGNGEWTPGKAETVDVFGMEHSSIWGKANDNKPQHINLLTMKTDGYSSKLVTWSVVDGNKKYTRQYLDDIASDYEKTHPGWIVVGGINADQYTTGFGSDIASGSAYFTPQTYYPLIMDGESRIPITFTNITNMHVGFANNGSENSLVPSSTIRSFVLTIVDENKKEIAKFDIDNINQSPSNNETTVWSTYISISKDNTYVEQNIDSENSVYVVENPELAYMNNSSNYSSGVDSVFGKGTISKVTKNVTLKSNQFAIETTNEEVINALSVGTRIIVDAEWVSEELNNVEASTGYHSVHRMNGVDQPLVHTSYDGNRYSRAIVGKKADGTYVLLTVDVATDPNDLTIRYAGMGFDECNALLKHYGVVEAYQMDGGGSVTSMYRDEKGEFVISNYPRDGIRANMTALLFVVRDPEVKADTNYHSVTLKKTTNLVEEATIENVVVKVNGKDYNFNNNELTIDGLNENTKYNLTLEYGVVLNDNSKKMTKSIEVTTKEYEGISPKFEVLNINKTSFDVSMEPNELIRNVKVVINGDATDFVNNKAELKNLILDTEYNLVIEYDIYDEVTSNLYHRKNSELKAKTLSYEIPTITEFKLVKEYTNKVNLQYAYKDEDGVVTKAVIVCNGQEIKTLKLKQGLEQVTDLDLENNSYELKIVLTYTALEDEFEVESNILSLGNTPKPTYNIEYILDGGTLPDGVSYTYEEGKGLESLPTPSKEGYTFLGWYNEQGEKVESISKTATGDIKLTARYEEIKQEEKKGCGCGTDAAIRYVLALTTLLALSVVILRKKK